MTKVYCDRCGSYISDFNNYKYVDRDKLKAGDYFAQVGRVNEESNERFSLPALDLCSICQSKMNALITEFMSNES